MTLPAPTYDLVLVLDPQAEADARAKIVADARASIEAQGELLRHDEWGERPLAYPIERRTSGEYHLLQFHAGDSALLAGLDRSLRITDGILRFRLVKLAPGVPDAPHVQPAVAAAQPSEPSAEAEPSTDAQDDAELAVGEPA
jgi:small subunit ribosomal protein S6